MVLTISCTTSLAYTMEFLNIGSTGFKEAMNQVMQGSTGNDTIQQDSVVKLTKVVRVNEDKDDKISSIMLVFSDADGGTITDFRNFSGKSETAFAKQVQAHIWTLNTLGNKVELDELQDTISDDPEASFNALYELFVDKFEGAKAKGKTLGIEVDHDLTSQRYIITKYSEATSVSNNTPASSDVPF